MNMQSRRLLGSCKCRITILFAVLICGAVSLLFSPRNVHAKLSDKHIADLLRIAPRVNASRQPYPQMKSIVEKEGLVDLARELLAHKEPALRELGLTVAMFHRLVMLRPEIAKIITVPKETRGMKGFAMAAMAYTGIPLRDALDGISDSKTQAWLVSRYGFTAPMVRRDIGDSIWMAMLAFLRDESKASGLRQIAWSRLSGARLRADERVPVLDIHEWQEWAEKLKVSETEYVQGLLARRPENLAIRLAKYLDSADHGARVLAASSLAYDFHDAIVVPILIESMPHFEKQMPRWGSVGFCAYQGVMRIDEGALIRIPLEDLLAQENKELKEIAGGEPVVEDAMAKLSLYFVAGGERDAKKKNKVARIIADWWKRRPEMLDFTITRQQLRIVRPVPPDVSPENGVNVQPSRSGQQTRHSSGE